MKKKLFTILECCALTTVMAFGAAGCDGNNGNSGNSSGSGKVLAEIRALSNAENLMIDADIGGRSAALDFNALKGDIESAQLVFKAKENISSFDFVMGDAVHTDGKTKLSADMFEVFAEKYLETEIPSSDSALVGSYPDPLVPIAGYKSRRENRVSKGENQGLWVNLNVPKDALAGSYTGEAVLTLNDQKIKIPVNVKIYNAAMPEEIHSRSLFYLDDSMLVKYEGGSEEIRKKYYDFFVKYRANLAILPGYPLTRTDVTKYIEDYAVYAQNPMVSAIALPYTATVVDGVSGIVDKSYCVEVLTAIAKKNVELRKAGNESVDLFKKAVYYLGTLIDEPVPAAYPRVKQCDLLIHQAKLEVAALNILAEYPDLQESVKKVNHIVTTKINEALYGTDTEGGIQTWCPLFDYFSSGENRKTALERLNSTDRQGGEDVWWYGCVGPRAPYPNYHIDSNVMQSRIIGWMQYDYQIHGNLYYRVNLWNKWINGQYVDTDIWKDPRSWESVNGDGRLIYPGSRYGVKGPISSIRMENIREGNEDYELLWLCEQGINEINAQKGTNFVAANVLSKWYDYLYTDVFVNENVTGKEFAEKRVELLELIELIYNDADEAVKALGKLN